MDDLNLMHEFFKEGEASEEEIVSAEKEGLLEAETQAGVDLREEQKCMMLPAVSVARNVRFHSSQQEASQFFAVTALGRADQETASAQEAMKDLNPSRRRQAYLQSNSIRLIQSLIRFFQF